MDNNFSDFADVVLDDNAQRLPLVLCLDTSSSMRGEPVETLNQALRDWVAELHDDVSLAQSVELAIITFGGQRVTAWQGPTMLPPNFAVNPFVPAHLFRPPRLEASGVTLMTEAIELAIHLVAARKAELRRQGLQYHRPQVCLVTDGQPTDPTGHLTDTWRRLIPVLEAEHAARRFRLFAIGVGGIDPRGEEVLRELAPKFNARLQGFPFGELLQMMSASASAEQRGAGDEVFERIFARFGTQKPAWET